MTVRRPRVMDHERRVHIAVTLSLRITQLGLACCQPETRTTRTSPMIYVAGSSEEIERAEKWSNALRGEGITVTSVWPETIRRVQRERGMKTTQEASNPREATVADRRKWSMENVTQILACEVFWLLVPTPPYQSQGAYWEHSFAWHERKLTVASGGDQRFVFVSLSQVLCETDEQAFDLIRHIYKRRAAL